MNFEPFLKSISKTLSTVSSVEKASIPESSQAFFSCR